MPQGKRTWRCGVTAAEFRRMALGFEGAKEREHMGHPDFRVGGRIFATMGYPDKGWAMVKLTPEQQHEFNLAEPDVFVPVKGGWGRKGATQVRLKTAKQATIERALAVAWKSTGPKRVGAKTQA